ncbi:hypothetical protein CCC_03911 [Paramagnetospirillum magnetotacticum MS-1]|uniref:Uncharacterized protein n=1 Tax=Paramagnetospirillum magnetotacticum MS-1 TaxID=272627 RepID=A0A0C2YJ07_PARME|nr:hypothetical protein [Paramagnetospirillum magnetotacticum]KIL99739.1 hypothetical protein CCC_03911 [Paramagnetospirillum magnetotacticum MS-1]
MPSDLTNLVNALVADDPLSTITAKASPELLEETVSRDTETAINDEMLLDEHGHTRGMKSYVVLPILESIGAWQRRYREALHTLQMTQDRVTAELSYEAERQRLNADRKAKETAALNEHTTQPRYKELANRVTVTDKRYKDMLAENRGKIPHGYSRLYYIVPLMLVGLSEWFINYPTFREAYAPFFAMAATVIIAISFAAASHFHGLGLKQRLRMFNKSVDHRERIQMIAVIGLVTFFFLVALGTVTYERYGFISAQFGLSNGLGPDVLGNGRATESVEGRLLQTVILNILVWFAGCLVSYFFHDPIPNFNEARLDAQRAQDELEKFDRQFIARKEQIAAQFFEAEAALDSRAREQSEQLRTIRGLRERLLNSRVNVLRAASQQINANLAAYRNALVTGATRQRRNLVFGPNKIGLTQFNTERLEFPAAELQAYFPES